MKSIKCKLQHTKCERQNESYANWKIQILDTKYITVQKVY